MVQVIAGGRPPYVQFEERAVEDRQASTEAGRIVSKSEDWVIIRQIGGKDTVEKKAVDWLNSLQHNPNMLPEWARGFKHQYEQWKSGQEVTPDGTHVKTWALITRGEAETLINAGLRTVEDVAAAPEPALMAVGIGARSLQQKARAWLETAQVTGKSASELVALRATVSGQNDTIANLRQSLEEMERRLLARINAAAAPNEDFLADSKAA